uniref:Nuclear pore complex protein n=1 Tax=Macrostomum lignano TaxID=282301 RepID=A0A1I8GUD2_9PLAT
ETMLKLHAVERNWRTLLEALDSIGEHLRDNFAHYDTVFKRCDRYFMQKHGRKADTLHDIIVILNCRGQARAQVFLNDSDFDSLIVLLNQFYRLRDVHNAITYYYLYFSQDKQHQRQLESVINAANTAKIFINSVQEEGDQRRFAPKPFGKEEVKPHRKVWHVLSFLENSLLGLRPILEQLEDWQLEHRVHLDGQEIDFLQPLLSYRYGRVTEAKPTAPADDDEDGGMLRGRRLRGSQRQRQRQQQEPRRWEDQLRVHGEPIKVAPAFPKRFGGMVNNYLSARDDHYLQQRVDSYWEQEAALDEWRRRPVVRQEKQQQKQQPLLAIAAPPIASSRFQEASSGRYLEQIVVPARPPSASYGTDRGFEVSLGVTDGWNR